MRATALFWCLTLLHLQLRAAQQVELHPNLVSTWTSSRDDPAPRSLSIVC